MSFQRSKHLTMGDGGAILTNSKKLLDDIYDLIEKSWNPIIKSKSLLTQVILEIEDAISELK